MRCLVAVGYMLQSVIVVAMLLVCHVSSKDGQNHEHHNRHRHHNGETNRKGKWQLAFYSNTQEDIRGFLGEYQKTSSEDTPPFWSDTLLSELTWDVLVTGSLNSLLLRITQPRKCARDPPWLWNPGQTSPEVQNRGISGPMKRTYVLKI